MSRTRMLIAAVCVVAVAIGLGVALEDGSTPDMATSDSAEDQGGRAETSKPKHPDHQRIPPTTTPDLIDESPQAARDEAQASRIRVRFAPSHFGCQGPPGGAVVWQNPRPGTKTHYAGMQAGTSVQATCGQRQRGQPALPRQPTGAEYEWGRQRLHRHRRADLTPGRDRESRAFGMRARFDPPAGRRRFGVTRRLDSRQPGHGSSPLGTPQPRHAHDRVALAELVRTARRR